MTREEKGTQKKLAFYRLYQAYKEDPTKFLPTWAFIGEIFVRELNKWFLMSYKCPTRLTDLFQENPGLLERRITRGKSGARYYEYRIAPNPSAIKIKDETLFAFYKQISGNKTTKSPLQRDVEYAKERIKDFNEAP